MLNQMKKNHSQWGLHGQAHGWYHLQESQRRSREGEEHWQLHLSLKENSIILFGFFFLYTHAHVDTHRSSSASINQ